MSEREMFVCPTCGPRVSADEDGCCATCGEDCAVELWANAYRHLPESCVEDGCHYYVTDGDQEAAAAYRSDGEWFALPAGEALGWQPHSFFGPLPAAPPQEGGSDGE